MTEALPGAEALLAEARERTGLADFGDLGFRAGLDVLLDDLARAELSDLGRMVWRGRLLSHLVQRLRVEDWLVRHPEIERCPCPRRSSWWDCRGPARPRSRTCSRRIRARVRSGSGSPRSRCRRRRARPSTAIPRIEAATKQLEAMRQLSPRLAAMHEDTPTGPTENHDLLGMSFRTFHFEGMAWIPRYVAWWLDCDMVPAYRFHRARAPAAPVALPAEPLAAEVSARLVLPRRGARRRSPTRAS